MFKEYILNRLNLLGISQNECSRRSGFSHGNLSKIINGSVIPSVDNFIALARALRVDTADLLAAYQGKDPARLKGLPSKSDVLQFIHGSEDVREVLEIWEVASNRFKELLGADNEPVKLKRVD